MAQEEVLKEYKLISHDAGRGTKKRMNPPKGIYFLENISPCQHRQPLLVQAGVKSDYPAIAILFRLTTTHPCLSTANSYNCFYVGILCQALFWSKFYILTFAYPQMLLLATCYRKCCLCENGPLKSSSEPRSHSRSQFSPFLICKSQRLLITQKTACFP